MAKRLLVIGLDGASFTSIRPMASSGIMPTLARLLEEGFVATLHSTIPPVSAPAWSTFLTGKNPGKHGVYQFYDINPRSAGSLGIGEQTYLAIPGVVVNTHSIRSDKLWDWLGRAGKRLAVLNLPMAYPPIPINGVMITGMLTPPGSRQFTYPPELAEELPEYEIDLNPDEKDFSSSDQRFLLRSRQILDRRADAAQRLMRREPWDLFMVVFTETDRLQHRYWHYLDPECAPFSSEVGREVREELNRLYARLDQHIRDLMEVAGHDYETVILSDHGFGPAAERRMNFSALGRMLELDPAGGGISRLSRYRPSKRRVYRYLNPLIPEKVLKSAEARWREVEFQRVRGKLVKLHDYIGGVWVNVEREGKGVIPAGQEYEKFCQTMVEELWKLTDPDTGGAIVQWIKRREELYHGPSVAEAPDIIFGLHDDYGIDTGGGDRPMIYSLGQKNQGTHREEGILVMRGSAIRQSNTPLRVDLQDVAPTLLHLMDIPIPSGIDGRVVGEAFNPAYLSGHPVRFQSELAGEGHRPDPGSLWERAEDEEKVRERLEQLGYLE